jgi:hypothetical protein
MGHIHGRDRQQSGLFPDRLADDRAAANPGRFLDACVASLERNDLGFRPAIPHQRGRPSSHPGDLRTLSLYG